MSKVAAQKRFSLTGKPAVIAGVALGGGLALVVSMQQWVALKLLPGVATSEHVEVTGQNFNSGTTLIALATLAAALVLTIAGSAFRRVIGVLIALLGLGLAAIGIFAQFAPIDGARRQIEEVSGISGPLQDDLVSGTSVSAWPLVAAAIGLLLALLGITVVAVSGRWVTGGRKYESGDSVKRERTGATGDRISDWDALSDGDDPTEDLPSEVDAPDADVTDMR